MATHSDTTIGNDVARDTIVKSHWVMMVQWTSIVMSEWVRMSNDVVMCTYHIITMHNDIAMNLFNYVLSALCLIMILLLEVWNKNNKFMFEQSGFENLLLFLCGAISFILQTWNIPTQNTSHVFSPDLSNTHLFKL